MAKPDAPPLEELAKLLEEAAEEYRVSPDRYTRFGQQLNAVAANLRKIRTAKSSGPTHRGWRLGYNGAIRAISDAARKPE